MKLTFRGWRREVWPHTHDVIPVRKEDGGYQPIERRRSIHWTDPMTAYGRLEGLGLSGNFLVKFQFTEAELRSWLTSYFMADPQAAQRLVASVQVDAIRRLVKSANGK
jgi:hypothetical protein